MEPRYKHMNWFVRIITFGWPVAICLAPFGIYMDDEVYDSVYTRQHEAIHWRQQTEMLYIFFYLWYFIEWIIKLLTPPVGAYKDISFEREAKHNQRYTGYLDTRKRFAWYELISGKNS